MTVTVADRDVAHLSPPERIEFAGDTLATLALGLFDEVSYRGHAYVVTDRLGRGPGSRLRAELASVRVARERPAGPQA